MSDDKNFNTQWYNPEGGVQKGNTYTYPDGRVVKLQSYDEATQSKLDYYNSNINESYEEWLTRNNIYTIIGFNCPASPTFINKELDKMTTSLQEKPELNYDGKHAYHWNWCFGVFPNDEDIMDTY